MLCSVKVSATMVESCPGISTAATLSSEPEACGLARFRNEAMNTTTTTSADGDQDDLSRRQILLGCAVLFADLIVGPGDVVGGGGVVGGLDIGFS